MKPKQSVSDAPARPSLRQAQKQLTEQKLLDSAAQVLRERGYPDMTIEGIVEAAGASRGTFYLYFPTKAEIIVRLMENGPHPESKALIAALPGAGELSEAGLRQWITQFVDIYERHSYLQRAWVQAMATEARIVQLADDILRSDLEDFVAAVARLSGQRKNNKQVRLQATAMWMQIERICYFWFIRRWDFDRAILDVLATEWFENITRLSEQGSRS